MQPSLFNKYGIHVITFDIREVIGKPEFQDSSDCASMGNKDLVTSVIRSWLVLIQLHALGANVVLVGTYIDALRNGKVDLELELRGFICQTKTVNLVSNSNYQLLVFPQDNSER